MLHVGEGSRPIFELNWRPNECDKAEQLFDRDYEAANVEVNELSRKSQVGYEV